MRSTEGGGGGGGLGCVVVVVDVIVFVNILYTIIRSVLTCL